MSDKDERYEEFLQEKELHDDTADFGWPNQQQELPHA